MTEIKLTQREQWHMVTEALKLYTDSAAYGLIKELDKYIDHCEDIFDKMREEESNEI